MNKLERIMAKIQEICGLRCGQYCGGPNCPVFEDIAAIHAAPDTIEVEGVEFWVEKQYWRSMDDRICVSANSPIYEGGDFDFHWEADNVEGHCSDLHSALAAATAAIKGEKR
jgi:hypothetical protein